MANVPEFFPPQPDAAIASYNYFDIAEGTGVTIFYAAATTTNAATSYFLTRNQIYSSKTTEQLTDQGTTTMDFDLIAFNFPKTVKGTAYVGCCLGAAQNIVVHMTARVYHYDGTTATAISSLITSPSLTGGVSAASKVKQVFLPLPLTERHFASGETLRLEIQLVQENTTNGSEIGIDPQNRAGTWILPASLPVSTSLLFYCPFKITG